MTDSSVAAPAKPHFEIRKKLIVDGNPIDRYVVKTPLFFMMGDNRDNSADSRYWGFVTLRNIRAKAFVLYFSFENDDRSRLATHSPGGACPLGSAGPALVRLST